MARAIEKARRVFQTHGGILRTREAMAAGIHPRTLYGMRETGTIEAVARGVFRLADLPPLSEPDLVAAAIRVPRGVVCLISALAFHEMTTQVPHEIHLALPRTARNPEMAYPPLRIYRFAGVAFEAGIETHKVDAVALRVYSPEKTLADCFKYRNKIGLDVAVEALRFYRRRPKASIKQVLHYAAICRVERVIRPYLEAVL
ncbi:MAG: type IV toxin-antitoxin system AbiEi family antitoxin domain-containing protein [Planctomycetota bacterium]|nr:type IV toxin-antitoxin system AbiEi family antitoxin domain-containing protein [Planctomycetota bacterium]